METTDNFDGQSDRSQLKVMDVGTSVEDTTIDLPRALPLTGPIHVRGAEPGDGLVSEILGIVATSNAFISVLLGFSRLLLGDYAEPLLAVATEVTLATAVPLVVAPVRC